MNENSSTHPVLNPHVLLTSLQVRSPQDLARNWRFHHGDRRCPGVRSSSLKKTRCSHFMVCEQKDKVMYTLVTYQTPMRPIQLRLFHLGSFRVLQNKITHGGYGGQAGIDGVTIGDWIGDQRQVVGRNSRIGPALARVLAHFHSSYSQSATTTALALQTFRIRTATMTDEETFRNRDDDPAPPTEITRRNQRDPTRSNEIITSQLSAVTHNLNYVRPCLRLTALTRDGSLGRHGLEPRLTISRE
ncbi:hypothetical protein WN48_10317 [Eufriesea mexicana]|uniref:Uncharacterized protein n=1 Tax=Eufriesea mexicana TaxID=516756 RepID=A0A310SDX1_9HYME|nr:hypothetical protein WN48_10317 [Eufriesea mexicana]